MYESSSENQKKFLAEEAVNYAGLGWKVVPLHSFVDGRCTCGKSDCSSPAKHPLTPKGVKSATCDQHTINNWWSEAEIANVGIATGNGLLVLDIDAKSGGLESLAAWEWANGSLPLTPAVATGGGGFHYYFQIPAGTVIGNRAGIAPGIDLRGDAGYVVAPPSLHKSGELYRWVVAPGEAPLAAVPTWLWQLIEGRSKQSSATPMPKQSGGMKLTVQSADDLDSHPGAEEGQRNFTLCRLIGVHLARGEDESQIEGRALRWGDRCEPPVPAKEVLETLRSLAAKHQRAVGMSVTSEQSEDLESVPLPEPQRWPVLDEAAFYGVVGEIVRTLEPNTEADPVAIYFSLLLVFGNAVGRNPHFPIEGDHHHSNLFAVMVGDSSRGRKGTSMGRTLSLFQQTDPDWLRNCLTTGLSSGEGLVFAVRDPVEVMEPVKERGKVLSYQKVIKDQGVTDKRLLVTEPEFAQTLKVLKREGNTLSPIIRQAWDSGCLSVLTKNNSARATDTHISILGHITRPELAKCLCDTDCFNGFANRFLWVLVKRSKLLPDGGAGVDLAKLQQRIAAALVAAKKIGAMSRSAAARELWFQVYPELTAEHPGIYGSVVGRGEAQTLRLSMLFALLDGKATIEVVHLQAALAAWRYCDQSAKIIFADAGGETANPLEEVLLRCIRQEPGVNRRGLHRAIGGHVPAIDLAKALAALRDRNQARCEERSTGGRPSECWFPVEITLSVPLLPEQAESSAFLKELENTNQPVSGGEPQTIERVLSIEELFAKVSKFGGRFKNDGTAVTLDSPNEIPSEEVLKAVLHHQTSLLALYPIQEVCKNEKVVTQQDDDDPKRILPTEEFYRELNNM